MNATVSLAPLHKWTRAKSPKDGRAYATLLRNCIGDEWQSAAIADPTACNGWRNGKWQDWAGEVKAHRPIAPRTEAKKESFTTRP